MQQQPSVSAHTLGFEWPNGNVLFSNLSLSITHGRTAFVGPNGMGKSTLAKILAGQLQPTTGKVLCSTPPLYLAQFELPSEQTTGEYLLTLWESPDSHPELWAPLLDSIPMERPLSKLSGGEWMRVRLAHALGQLKGLLILDEPTNNLDQDTQLLIHNFIATYRYPLLLISHDKKLLQKVDAIYELSNRGLHLYGGNYEFYESQKTQERQLQSQKLERAKREKKKLEKEFQAKLKTQEKRQRKGKKEAERGGVPKVFANTHKGWAENTTAKIQVTEETRVKAAEKNVAEAYEDLKYETTLRLNLPQTSLSNKKQIVELVDANLILHQTLWKTPITFRLTGRSRKAIGGKNGAGKTSLVNALLGLHKNSFTLTGSWFLADIPVAFLDQNYSHLNFKHSVFENILQNSTLGQVEILNRLAAFQIESDKAHQTVESLSGGEKLKAALAKIFLADPTPEFLILDEPTNNLDLQSREVLIQALNEFGGPLLVISHDEHFLERLDIEETLLLERQAKGPNQGK